MTNDLQHRVSKLLEKYRARNLRIATAESCTGGLVAGLLTSIAGSSDVVECGFVTYSNESKISMLGIPSQIIQRHGAVSRECAIAMVEGALKHSSADIAVSVTGIAGPGGGSAEKPVGLVHFACGQQDNIKHRVEQFRDIGREQIRTAATEVALELLESQLP